MSRLSNTKARIAALLLLVASTLAAGAGSLALLQDTANINFDQQAATIDITVNGLNTVTFPVGQWYDAGQKLYQPVILRNNGNGELRYAVASTATGNSTLNGALAVSGRFNADPTRCTATEWSGLGATGPVDVTPDDYDIGNAAQGSQAGDRLLQPGEASMMCLQIRYAGGVTDGTLLTWQISVQAEQTYQNP